MIKEEEYEMLKTRMIKAYTDYINTAQKTSINDLNDWNKRRGLLKPLPGQWKLILFIEDSYLDINPLSHQKVQNS